MGHRTLLLTYPCILLFCLGATTCSFLAAAARAQGVPFKNPYPVSFAPASKLMDGTPALATINSNPPAAFHAQDGVNILVS
jgi:hypothetical protein